LYRTTAVQLYDRRLYINNTAQVPLYRILHLQLSHEKVTIMAQCAQFMGCVQRANGQMAFS
jgi:hypothetical protein